MNASYDVAVIGLGTMGSFACCELAHRRLRVIGFDRFAPPHTRGSHSGDSRVFRIAYAEHPDYVPLAQRASELWDEYTERGRAHLLTRCGVLSVGPPDGEMVRGIQQSARLHGLEISHYSSDEIRRTFPAFAPDDGDVGILEAAAGWVDANAAIETALRLAKQEGATLSLNSSALQWSHQGSYFEIVATTGVVTAEKIVIAAGAWASQLLTQLGLPLRVQRKVLVWVDPLEASLFQPGAFPVFISSQKFLYGFPAVVGQGVKIAVHWTPGRAISNPTEHVAEATLDDAAEPLEISARLLPLLGGPLPHALERVKAMKTCLYTMSHDEHFFVDRHPELPGLVFAAGFTGHGFKFAPAIGEALADLVTNDVAELPIGFLGTDRWLQYRRSSQRASPVG